jgi:hypothetical protein
MGAALCEVVPSTANWPSRASVEGPKTYIRDLVAFHIANAHPRWDLAALCQCGRRVRMKQRWILTTMVLVLGLEASGAHAATIEAGDLLLGDILDNRVIRVDPTTGESEVVIPDQPGSDFAGPEGIAVDAVHGLLFISYLNTGEIARFDPRTEVLSEVQLEEARPPDSFPADLEITPQGSLLFIRRETSTNRRVLGLRNPEEQDPTFEVFGSETWRNDEFLNTRSLALGLEGVVTQTLAVASRDDGIFFIDPELGTIREEVIEGQGGLIHDVAITGCLLNTCAVFFAEAGGANSCDGTTTPAIYQTTFPSGGVVTISSGGLLRCPLRFAVNTAATQFYVADSEDHRGTDTRIVELVWNPATRVYDQSLVSTAEQLGIGQVGRLVISPVALPEPGAGAAGLAALGTLALVSRKRSLA